MKAKTQRSLETNNGETFLILPSWILAKKRFICYNDTAHTKNLPPEQIEFSVLALKALSVELLNEMYIFAFIILL